MKFTSEDLMKAMGLQVGDKIKVYDRIYEFKKTYNGYFFDVVDKEIHKPNLRCTLTELLDQEYEILPRPKRVGQLTCRENKDCRTCPLWWICFIKIDEKNEMQTSLYEMLESFAVKDQEIYDLLKARLDKEVE